MSDTVNDLTSHQPIRNNIPVVNVLFGDVYKVRAIVDTGATVTMVSTGLFNKMTNNPAVKMMPTSATYSGVGSDRQ